MPKVSVLMPAYNAQNYIAMAIESVIKQTYTDWELIIVDDRSTDATGKICDSFSQIDERIIVFHLAENCGISKSKNFALNHSQGDYISFCDDDDIMEQDALKDNMELIKTYNTEIVRWSYKTIKINGEGQVTDEIERKCEGGVYKNRKEIFDNYENVHEMLSCDWTGLYSKKMLDENQISFNENFKFGGEDTEFNLRTLEYVKSMVMNPKTYYYWFLRRNHSTTAKKDINFCYTMMEVAEKEYEIVKENCVDWIKLWNVYEKFYKRLIIDYSNRLQDADKKAIANIMDKDKWWEKH